MAVVASGGGQLLDNCSCFTSFCSKLNKPPTLWLSDRMSESGHRLADRLQDRLSDRLPDRLPGYSQLVLYLSGP